VEDDRRGRLGRAGLRLRPLSRRRRVPVRLGEDDPVAERVDHGDHPTPGKVLDPGVGVRILLGLEGLLQGERVRDGDQDAAARARVTVVTTEMDARVAPRQLRVERLVTAGLVAPVDAEAEVVDVEGQRGRLVEDPQDRHDPAIRRRDCGAAGGEGVPVPAAELPGHELEGFAVAHGDPTVGQGVAEPARHRLRVRVGM
jgi:hypothetical protein